MTEIFKKHGEQIKFKTDKKLHKFFIGEWLEYESVKENVFKKFQENAWFQNNPFWSKIASLDQICYNQTKNAGDVGNC